jgi:outer membrane protein assembly factor BamA
MVSVSGISGSRLFRLLLQTVAALLLLCPGDLLPAQLKEKEPVKDEQAVKDAIDDERGNVTVIKYNDFYFIPVLYYKPETQFAGGLAFLSYYRPSSDSKDEVPLSVRPSTLAATAVYTQNQQYILQLFPEAYFQQETYHLVSQMEYLHYPDKFWGVGNNTKDKVWDSYTSNKFRMWFDLQRELVYKIYIGLVFQYEHSNLEHVSDTGIIKNNKVTGLTGGISSGIGFSLSYDNRDNNLSTRYGSLFQFSAVSFSEVIASRYNFAKFTLDLRKFFPLWYSHVLALQVYYTFVEGEAPFEMLPMVGGKSLLRGYFEGRYRDNNMMIYQAEYRMHLFWRIGLVVFGGAGEVAHTMKDFGDNYWRYSAGSGLRYVISKQEKLYLRFDVAWSPQMVGFYATVLEAF